MRIIIDVEPGRVAVEHDHTKPLETLGILRLAEEIVIKQMTAQPVQQSPLVMPRGIVPDAALRANGNG